MPEELATGKKVVGLKQVHKAVMQGRAVKVYVACDAEERLAEPLLEECRQAEIPTDEGCTMQQLGRACSIAVGTAAVAMLAE